jgi:Bifunctional DNA primase/polymerase, N-terminal
MDFDHDLGSGASKTSTRSTCSRFALTYAERGWRVLPLWWPRPGGACACGRPDCDSAGKHPIHRLVPRGLHDATSQLDTVARWWRSAPNANVGIRTGLESGLVVLDVDGPPGRQALRALVAAHGLFQTRWARTGGGGWHGYFAHPGATVPSSAGRVGDRLDVRGEGGYVVAPPSRHWTGRSYRWIVLPDDSADTEGARLPALPGWLLQLALHSPSRASRPSEVRLLTGDADAYAVAAVEREADKVAHAPAGQRNHRLNRAAFRLGQLIAAGLLDERTATTALVDAGLAAGPGERKIRSTVQRGIRAGKRHPRHVLPLRE